MTLEHVFYDDVYIKDPPFRVLMKKVGLQVTRYGFFVMPGSRLEDAVYFRAVEHSGVCIDRPDILGEYSFELTDMNRPKFFFEGRYNENLYRFVFKRGKNAFNKSRTD